MQSPPTPKEELPPSTPNRTEVISVDEDYTPEREAKTKFEMLFEMCQARSGETLLARDDVLRLLDES
jgi:hypothetical protein